MEQNREPRNKPMALWSISFRQRQEHINGVKTASSLNGVGRAGQLHVKKSNLSTNLHHTQKETQSG